MKNLTFIGYIIEKNILDGCIVLANYIWQPQNEDTPFYNFSISLLNEIFEDYKKTNSETGTLLDAIQEIVYVSQTIEKHAREQGVKEHKKRQANSFVCEY